MTNRLFKGKTSRVVEKENVGEIENATKEIQVGVL